MSHPLEHQLLHSPAILGETGFGFDAHPLELTRTERRVHHDVLDAALADVRVQEALSVFDAYDDEPTRLHSLRVGSLAVGTALYMGREDQSYNLDYFDLGLLARGALIHDLGKADDRTQAAITSPLRFAEHPELRVSIQRHPINGGFMARDIGFGDNESMMVAAHHGFQDEEDHPGYGIKPHQIKAFPEADGHVPETVLLAEIGAAADHFDATSVDPKLSGRKYQAGRQVSPAKAIASVSALKVRPQVKHAIVGATGYRDLHRAA